MDKNTKMIYGLWGRLVLLAIAVGALLRIVLACHGLTVASSITAIQWINIFLVGAVNDACVMTVFFVPLWAFLASSGHWKLQSPQRWVFLGLLAMLWAWIKFGWTTLHEFNGGLTRVLGWVVVFWIVSFALRSFLPRLRKGWMRAWTALILFAYMAVLTLNTCGEWLFWDEFGVRYNFIAVDYLIYTSEVVGNIMQSYSMGWIAAAVVAIALILEWGLFRKYVSRSADLWRPGWRLKTLLAPISVILAIPVLYVTESFQGSDNAWYNQLQANGAYSFARAFMKNHLDYEEFYISVPQSQIEALAAADLAMATDTIAKEPATPNIVLVTIESMSASYMERFGNTDNLAPTLDSLWLKSLAFDNMFAAGNRTVRGLEALTLSRPPAPGESVIKRPDAPAYPSIADKLKSQGYDCYFYYGGDSYFDNMEQFFSGLGYEIKDRKTMAPSDITCQTVWGVCDGDVYNRLANDLDSAYAKGERVYAHVMTTSNHRPFIYPEGCISIPPSTKTRKGAVMYSDYALGQFFKRAAASPWHDNTVFVVVADHCASSAGSTQLPLVNYHIPCLIYSPQLIEPQVVGKTASQVDVFPTLFSLLGWQSDSLLYGRDILAPGYPQRAFLATYQDMGYYSNDTLTVLSPGRKARQYAIAPSEDDPYSMQLIENPDSAAINRAAALYQRSAQEQ